MACTSLMVGKAATTDGSTLLARNEDTGSGTFDPKTWKVVEPEEQPRTYTGVASHRTYQLPDDPVRYTIVPNADPSQGVWGEAGINAHNVAMSSTETTAVNERTLGADPLVCYQPAVGEPGQPGYKPEVLGGVGEENMPTLVLPYIKTAREGCERLGALIEEYGTYEVNAIGFSDVDDIWWFESIGGHHWMARRVPDDCYVANPNRLGNDYFDLADAYGEQNEFMCDQGLVDWMKEYHLDTTMELPADENEQFRGLPRTFNPRKVFGTNDYLDYIYNTPRAWYMQRTLSPEGPCGGPDPQVGPGDIDLPWAVKPAHKLGVTDVKYCLQGHYEETPYDPYGFGQDDAQQGKFRPIGINRNSETSILQIRPSVPEAYRAVQWLSMSDMNYSTCIPLYVNASVVPDYVDVKPEPDSHKFYWAIRLIAGLADPEYLTNFESIEGYQSSTLAAGLAHVAATDKKLADLAEQKGLTTSDWSSPAITQALDAANQEICESVKAQTTALLGQVLYVRTCHQKDAFALSDR